MEPNIIEENMDSPTNKIGSKRLYAPSPPLSSRSDSPPKASTPFYTESPDWLTTGNSPYTPYSPIATDQEANIEAEVSDPKGEEKN